MWRTEEFAGRLMSQFDAIMKVWTVAPACHFQQGRDLRCVVVPSFQGTRRVGRVIDRWNLPRDRRGARGSPLVRECCFRAGAGTDYPRVMRIEFDPFGWLPFEVGRPIPEVFSLMPNPRKFASRWFVGCLREQYP